MATTTNLVVLAIFSTASFASVIEPKIDPALNWRIVGGSDAAQGQFPWQVSIRRASTYGHNCGAAHCVVNTSPSTWYIVAGTLTLSSGGNQHQIARIISHADYNSAQIKNDVAVLELEEELEFSARRLQLGPNQERRRCSRIRRGIGIFRYRPTDRIRIRGGRRAQGVPSTRTYTRGLMPYLIDCTGGYLRKQGDLQVSSISPINQRPCCPMPHTNYLFIHITASQVRIKLEFIRRFLFKIVIFSV
ncbi:Trypsin [Popillia japonica]|uniref:Trypsin n=1 Tax=Popillia japonica TaxID=7064 RepID=A0AAW1NB63_POPJA